MQDSPPIALKNPRQLTAHGDIRVDPWYWLQDIEDPDTLAYLTAENSFTEHTIKTITSSHLGPYKH